MIPTIIIGTLYGIVFGLLIDDVIEQSKEGIDKCHTT